MGQQVWFWTCCCLGRVGVHDSEHGSYVEWFLWRDVPAGFHPHCCILPCHEKEFVFTKSDGEYTSLCRKEVNLFSRVKGSLLYWHTNTRIHTVRFFFVTMSLFLLALSWLVACLPWQAPGTHSRTHPHPAP
jgi:hypothetical protein